MIRFENTKVQASLLHIAPYRDIKVKVASANLPPVKAGKIVRPN
jgi:hypothetical protein